MEWKQFLFGEHDHMFLPEVLLRTLVMFIVILSGLRLLGKRGVKQLSVFELVVIIGLGSAAGDPMFYKEVGILPAIVVFISIILLYRQITWWVGKSKWFEALIEGKPVCLINEGRFSIDNFKKESLAQDEFFAELRLKSVSHLGQISKAIIETSGEISIFYYPDDGVKYGLPILPGAFFNQNKNIEKAGIYACTFCGTTERLKPVPQHVCPECGKDKWVAAINDVRIA